LLAVSPDQVGELSLRELIHQIRRPERLPPVHPHVQRSCRREREPPPWIRELHHRGTEIEQHPVDPVETQRLENHFECREVLADERDGPAEPLQPPGRLLQRLLVPIDPDQPPTWNYAVKRSEEHTSELQSRFD